MPVAQINGHNMYYEVHGEGLRLSTLAAGIPSAMAGTTGPGMTDKYSTLIIDYRGIGESDDDLSMTPSTEQFADDIAALLDLLNMKSVYFVGLVGMGACIGQWWP